MYDCNNPLTGFYIELRRTDATNTNEYGWIEIRAYENPPMALTTSMLSSNIGGVSLAEALNFSVSLGREYL